MHHDGAEVSVEHAGADHEVDHAEHLVERAVLEQLAHRLARLARELRERRGRALARLQRVRVLDEREHLSARGEIGAR